MMLNSLKLKNAIKKKKNINIRYTHRIMYCGMQLKKYIIKISLPADIMFSKIVKDTKSCITY